MASYPRCVPGFAMLRDITIVGNGIVADVFEDAGFYTINNVRTSNLDDVSDDGIMKRLMYALDRKRECSPRHDWNRIARKAYHIILQIQAADIVESTDVPEGFRCPLSHTWIEDAVITPEGHTYDRRHIERWLAVSETDPMTRSPLAVASLIPNRALQRAIDRYRPLEQRFLV